MGVRMANANEGDWIEHECTGGRDRIETSASAAAATGVRMSVEGANIRRGYERVRGGRTSTRRAQGVRTSAEGTNEQTRRAQGVRTSVGRYERGRGGSGATCPLSLVPLPPYHLLNLFFFII